MSLNQNGPLVSEVVRDYKWQETCASGLGEITGLVTLGSKLDVEWVHIIEEEEDGEVYYYFRVRKKLLMIFLLLLLLC